MIINVCNNGHTLRIKRDSWHPFNYVEINDCAIYAGREVVMMYFPNGTELRPLTDGQALVIMPRRDTEDKQPLKK